MPWCGASYALAVHEHTEDDQAAHAAPAAPTNATTNPSLANDSIEQDQLRERVNWPEAY